MAGQYNGHGFILTNGHPTLPATLGLNRQVSSKVVGESQVIHHWAAGLILEYPVYPGNKSASARTPASAYPYMVL
jgi:hypothetical protein